MLEFARDGEPVDQVISKASQMIGRNLVQNGVEKMIKQITIEATFSDGLKTVFIFYLLHLRLVYNTLK